MANSSINSPQSYYSPRASLVALGLKLQKLKLFRPIEKHVKIKQKVLKYPPTTKLYQLFVAILAGMESLVELNKVLRADPALQQAFGLEGCAEQSTIQATLDKCDQTNLDQLEQAWSEIYRQFGQAPQHNFQEQLLVLDSDFTANPCGYQAEQASKGYFGKLHHHFGRQIGRLIATQYEEIVVERLYGGNVQLNVSFQALVLAAEKRLGLDQAKRERTVLRADSGAGSVENINWALGRGYHYHGKSYGGGRANAGLIESVKEWVKDPKQSGREVGWVGEEGANPYLRPLKRVAVRCRKQNGQWATGLIVSSLSEEQVLGLTKPGQMAQGVSPTEQVLLGYVYYYDQRGGGIETEIKEDRQGLGLGHRNKRHFEGQAVLQQLLALAHNVLVWARSWLSEKVPEVAHYGLKRLVRDVFGISGLVKIDKQATIHKYKIELNQFDPLTKKLLPGLVSLLPQPAT